MSKQIKTVIVTGFEPEDLLRLSTDAFYDVIQERYNLENEEQIEVTEVVMAFSTGYSEDGEDTVDVFVKIIDYQEL